jgi:hypothetical protein
MTANLRTLSGKSSTRVGRPSVAFHNCKKTVAFCSWLELMSRERTPATAAATAKDAKTAAAESRAKRAHPLLIAGIDPWHRAKNDVRR